MNVLDENINSTDREKLRARRFPIKHIGHDFGKKFMSDDEVRRLLLTLSRPTLFTYDADYYGKTLCHNKYALVWLDINEEEISDHFSRFMRHPKFKTKAQRMGRVFRVMKEGIRYWRKGARRSEQVDWPAGQN